MSTDNVFSLEKSEFFKFRVILFSIAQELEKKLSCVAEFDECSSSPCLNGGTCTDGANNYTCSCPSPFFGNQCQGNRMHNSMF